LECTGYIAEEREHDGIASEMMKEGSLRRWERLTNRLVLFSPATLVHGKGSRCHVAFFSQVLFVFLLRFFSFTLPGGAMN
jgi:hypothetical protein